MVKTAVIDIGSNSVRCAVFNGNAEEWKKLITTRLGEGVKDGFLSESAMRRTALAIEEFKMQSVRSGVTEIYAFATEAVRSAANGNDFILQVKNLTGIEVYTVSGETEALLAVSGALEGADGAVVDLGGASTEVAVCRGGEILYARSVHVGAVLLKDACGSDRTKLTAFIAQKAGEYGNIPKGYGVTAVGGTATSLAACILGLKKYNSDLVHNSTVTVDDLEKFINRIEGFSPKEIIDEYSVESRRAEIIFGGAMLLKEVVSACGADKFRVSEKDNLEGFYNLLLSGKVKPAVYVP